MDKRKIKNVLIFWAIFLSLAAVISLVSLVAMMIHPAILPTICFVALAVVFSWSAYVEDAGKGR